MALTFPYTLNSGDELKISKGDWVWTYAHRGPPYSITITNAQQLREIAGEVPMKITIDLKVSFQDESKYEMVKDAARKAAQRMLTTASLIQDGVPPQVKVYGEDFLMGEEEIKLIKAEDE